MGVSHEVMGVSHTGDGRVPLAHGGVMAARLGSSWLGATTFWVRVHRPDECDGRGLPLTPNSIRVLGRFQSLLALEHQNICTYLDLKKANNGETGSTPDTACKVAGSSMIVV